VIRWQPRTGSLYAKPVCATLAILPLLGLLGLSGCTVGPKYAKPTAEVPAAYKESGQWKDAQPSDAIAKGKWWEIYQDAQLNSLEEQIRVSNQNLKAAQAQFEQARAAVRISRSFYYPTISGGATASGTRQSQNKALRGTSSSVVTYADYQIPIDVSYEADLWGRIRRTVESSRAQAQASAADLANVDLSLHSELALDYFELRGLDAQKQLLETSVIAFQKALELTQNRYQGGIASAVDVAQAQTVLETTRSQAIDVGVQRAALQHAIAVLIGQPASKFSLSPLPLATPPPPVPEGLPSELLERRPDIAAAERLVQAANAQIGVARAAYFPLVTLSGTGGFESAAISTLIQGPSGFWSIGPSAIETLFDAGRRRAISDQARAAYNQSVALYRQAILTSFQEVEDNLAALRILQEESQTQTAAVAAAERSLTLSNNRYKGGVSNYLEVITAQNAALSNERTAVDLLTRRMAASVLLIKAIGGGWNVSQIHSV